MKRHRHRWYRSDKQVGSSYARPPSPFGPPSGGRGRCFDSPPSGVMRMALHPLVRPARCEERRGTTVVETAIVFPVFLLFVLALVEFGHAVMVKNVLRSACRSGAGAASRRGWSTASVQ